MNHHKTDSEPSWFERPANINRMIGALVVVCAGLVAADWFYENPHPHFDLETSFGFQAWFGFVAFIVVVFLGRLLRLLVSKPEDYYERRR
ncbi:heme biosynthesis HemY N-terminal domain-containing protein [Rubripirellula reticaptiva]|uniref:Uncharacterized protein n=1 Tax=Rubripirellula reticaptiva TaxID=2528013 RepID=A0A5C6EI12_9BACT|nr:heme biosynthesis HemY N-terminal domain-containing protein [Rubripirellula reticaptiva]TWU48124.1 hypothetical protein Poly59_49690 [Rubripirellula reticaptiva]